jgi:hypothetical protein
LAIALPNSISMGQAIHRFADDLEVPLDRLSEQPIALVSGVPLSAAKVLR